MRSNVELVSAGLDSDRAAYGELVQRYSRAVLTTAWQILGDYHAAQDVAQETFFVAYQKLGSLRNRSMFGPCVLKITQRLARRSALRRDATRPLETAGDPSAPSEGGQLEEDLEHLLGAVTRLPEHERIVVILRYFEGHGVQMIADMTGRPLGTVTKQLTRALRRLEKSLKEVET